MAEDSDCTFLRWLEVFRPALRRSSFEKLIVIAVGWVLAGGRRTITGALLATGVAGRRHHESFHRFFSRRAWCPDALGRRLFERVLCLVGDGPIEIVIDDTLTPRKGPKVFGLGNHVDAVRSTRRVRVFTFGHIWVVLAVRVKLPFATRAWALPLLFRLYRNTRDCAATGDPYRKKTELAREMLDELARWTDRRIHVLADLAYCCDTVQRGLAERFTVFGTMRPDAVLTALPTDAERKQTGRRRRRGRVLPKPEQLARDATQPWLPLDVVLYGRRTTVFAKSICAQWYQACGTRLLHVVVVRMEHGSLPWRVFFSTDAELSPARVLETYAGRWALEVTFRELKQHLGFGECPARLRRAVERTAPLVGLLFTAIALWACDRELTVSTAALPTRPWYRQKLTLSFEDVLRAAQRDVLRVDVLDLLRRSENLQYGGSSPRTRPTATITRAA